MLGPLVDASNNSTENRGQPFLTARRVNQESELPMKIVTVFVATLLFLVLFASSNAKAGTAVAVCEKCAAAEEAAQGSCSVEVTKAKRSWRRSGQVFGYLRQQPVRNVVRWSGNVVLPPYPVARVVIGLQPRVTCQFVQSNGCCQ